LTRRSGGRTVPAVPRFTRLLAAPLIAAAVVVAGCGDETTVQVTVTVKTGTTAPVATAPPVTTAPATTPTTPGASLEFRLPAQDSVPSLRNGTAQQRPTADSMVNSLYAAGDQGIPAAVARLTAAGYETGVLRDQRGANPSAGLTLFRMYIYRLRDRAAAQAEVEAATAEVRATTAAPIRDVTVPGIVGAKALRISPVANGQQAEVLYVTWAAGRDVYGIQAFATQGGKLYQPQVIDLAESLYLAWNDAP